MENKTGFLERLAEVWIGFEKHKRAVIKAGSKCRYIDVENSDEYCTRPADEI